MYFRLDTSEVQCERIEYSINGFLGDIAGIAELLTKISALLFGGYLSFNSSIEIMKGLYCHDD